MAQFASFDTLSIIAQNDLREILTGYKAQSTLNYLNKLNRELHKAYKNYQKLENAQRKTYDNQYDILYNTYLIDVEIDNTILPPIYNIPSFEELDNTRLQSDLSETSFFLFHELIDEFTLTFQEVFELLNKAILEQEKNLVSLAPKSNKLIGFKGVLFPTIGNNNIPENAFAIAAVQQNENVWSWILVIQASAANKGIHSVDYALYQSELISSQTASRISKHGNSIYVFHLFENGIDLSSYPGQLSLEVTIMTSNQQTLQLNIELSLDVFNFGLMEVENELGGSQFRSIGGNMLTNDHDRKTGITRLGIAEYKRVEQTVCCYEAGEVAHIENVMAKEFKEKTVKSTKTAESSQKIESSSEQEKSIDISSSSRNEMQQEIASILQQSRDFNINTSVQGGFSKWGFSVNSGLAMHNSKEQSNNMAISKSQEITEKALEKILSKTQQERTSRTVEEYSEESKHGFDNRENTQHIAGVYRWIDKVYKNEIYNYGKRLMYEFMIPEPARFHHLWVNNSNPKEELVIEKPIDPRTEIADFGALTQFNYIKWVSLYNAEVEAPPSWFKYIGSSYSGIGENGKNSHNFNDLRIPEGYICDSIHCQFNFRKHANNNTNAHVIVGDFVKKINKSGSSSEGYEAAQLSTWSISGSTYTEASIPISIVTWDVGAFALNVSVTLSITDELMKQWQLTTFNAIMVSYYDKLNNYEEIVKKYHSENTERRNTNLNFYREIEQIVLRKNCISYLLGHENMGIDGLYVGETLTSLNINRDNLNRYAETIKFLEQAFEWEIMGYIFYPFYWAQKDKWEGLYSQNSIYYDDTFVKFMESGMARVIVTIRPGFEDSVNWFLETGEIWNGTTPPVIGDELYLSIVDELQNPEYQVEGSWETRVPSNLMLIQKGSVGLNAEGLPCECKKVFDENGILVSGSPDLIYQVNPEGVGYWVVNPNPEEE